MTYITLKTEIFILLLQTRLFKVYCETELNLCNKGVGLCAHYHLFLLSKGIKGRKYTIV